MDFEKILSNMTDRQLEETIEDLRGQMLELEELEQFTLFNLIVYEILLDRMELVKFFQELQRAHPA